MGSQKSSESTSYSGSGQLWAKPFAKQGVNAAFNVFNKNQPTIERLSANASGLSDRLMARFDQGAAGAGVGRQHFMDTIARGPQNNPFLDQILGRMRSNVTDDVNSQFSLAGRYGSGAHTGLLADRLADAESSLRFQDMNSQQARMDAAANSLAGANQGEAAQALGALPVAAELPFTGTNALANQLAALFSGGSNKSVSYAPNPLWGALGAGLGAAGAYFGKPSERRLKKNITKVGELADGLPVYDFIYRNDPDEQVQRGVMVDEVEKLRPWALGPKIGGIQTVNYAHIEPL